MTFLPPSALDPIEEIAEDTLIHDVQLLDEVTVTQPGMKITKTWVAAGPVRRGLLAPASAGGTNIRADQPSVAGEWVLKMEKGVDMNATQRAQVTGETDEGETWTRLVALRRVLHPRPHELLREALAVDVKANPA